MICGIVLAAGAATPTPDSQEVPQLDGRPLVEHAVLAMAASGLDRFVVVLGAADEPALSTLELFGGEAIVCERSEDCQAAALATGLAAVGDADAVVVTLGSQPGMAPEAIYRVLSQRGSKAAVRATYDEVPGHPVVLEREMFDSLRDVTGDAGVRGVLRRAEALEVPCDDLEPSLSVSAPADLVGLRLEGARA